MATPTPARQNRYHRVAGPRGPGWPTARRFARPRGVFMLLVLAGAVAAGCSDRDRNKAAHNTRQPAGTLDAAALRKRVIGHTVTGRLGADDGYREFFARNGSIHGVGYRAQWRIERNRLCLDYDPTPAADCYRVRVAGDTLRWLQHGQVRGVGRIVEGNPERL